ncbi:hypothetical protein Avbf_12925 [Armadillidium vulgare]|nr:hypothetical protein Avbf_12925 [Armadillidium vulgare]
MPSKTNFHQTIRTLRVRTSSTKNKIIIQQNGNDQPKLDPRLNEVEYKGKKDPLDTEEQPQPQPANEFQFQKNEGIRRPKREINDQCFIK